jgi:uncharacterized protein (TIGR02147 family)
MVFMQNETVKIQMTYQHILLSEFESRKIRNSSYSLRAYARDLDLAAPKLSEILRGKCGLSEKSAQLIAKKLNLSIDETQLFINLVNAKHARSHVLKKKAAQKLSTINSYASYSEISLETFKIIADWQHFAILELTEVCGFQSSTAWIAQRLNISFKTADEAIMRLIDFGLLKKNELGSWVQTHKSLATPSGIPSSEIKKHHRQVLAKAEESLINDPVSERDFSTMTMALPKAAYSEIQNEIKNFRRMLAAKYLKTNNKERLYSLAIQLFPLDKKKGENL